MIIQRGDKKFSVIVRISGSNRLPDGKRQNTMRSVTLLNTTVDEVEKIILEALRKAEEPT